MTMPAEDAARTDQPTSELTERHFRRIAAIAREDAGLLIFDTKRLMVQSRIGRRMRASGHASIDAYLDTLTRSTGARERRALVSVLTTNVTSFFREAHHFEKLEGDVLPTLGEAARAGERIRIWSAGCATGQEPYSIALSVLATAPELADLDIRILATDIDQTVLERARRGAFREADAASIPAHIPPAYYRHGAESGISLSPEVRNLVAFRELNLHGSWPMKAAFDAIFCRNVLIYFDAANQKALWQRFHAQLKPGGWLFLGHSERIHPLDRTGFSAEGITTYRRVGPWTSAPPKGA